MLERRSLRAPVALGVVMIVLVVALLAIWIVGTALAIQAAGSFFLFFLVFGTVLLAVVLAGVIAYLTLTVKAINLNRRQSNFIDSVTHELKSPIASLKLYLQTMSRREVSAQERHDFHRTMLEDVERLDSLINHLLDVARVDRMPSKRSAELTDVRIDKLLQHCGTATCLRYDIDSQSVSIDVPPIALRQPLVELEILFRNLIDNAVKYGGSPPQVNITAKQEGDRTLITIEDNGPGIPPNLRRKVFGRFVRLGNELERSQQGTGLGLYLVRNVARSIGGIVTVHDRFESSDSEKTGSRFLVSLPGGQLNADDLPDSSSQHPNGSSSEPPNGGPGSDRSKTKVVGVSSEKRAIIDGTESMGDTKLS